MMTVLLPILLLVLASPPEASSFKFGLSRHAYLAAPYQEVRYFPQVAPLIAAPAPAPIVQQQLPAQATKGGPILEQQAQATLKASEQQTTSYETNYQAAPLASGYVSAPLVLAAAPTRALPLMPLAVGRPAIQYQNHYLAGYPYGYRQNQFYDYANHYSYSPYRSYAAYYSQPRYTAAPQTTPLYALEQHHSFVRDYEEPENIDGKLARIKSGLNQVLAKLTTYPEQQGYFLMPSAPAAPTATISKTQITQQHEQTVEQQREAEQEQQIHEQQTEQHEEIAQTKLGPQAPTKEIPQSAQPQAKGFKELDSQRTHQAGHQDENGFKRSGPL